MTIFILLTLLFLVYELRILVNPSKFINLRKQIQDIKKLEGDQKRKMSKEIVSTSFNILVTNFLYGIWCIIGAFIFTQWYLFLFLIFLSFFSSYILNTLISLEKATYYYKTFDTLLSIIVLILILISYFYTNLYNNLI